MTDILIIGGGPAGLTAALYAARAGKSVLVLEKNGFGGQIAWSPRVENYPGIESIAGAALAEQMTAHALAQGAELDIAEITSLRRTDAGWLAQSGDGEEYAARAVVLATGAEHRRLGLPNEEALCGSGVSYCAVCDGSFYAGERVAVVGGGDSALQEALLLADVCERVYLIHRRRSFRGEKRLQERIAARENIELVTPFAVKELHERDGELSLLTLSDAETGETRGLCVKALFVALGLEPCAQFAAGVLPLDERGYAAAGEDCRAAEGLFAAGDCRAKSVRQLTTAVGDGAAAALAACRYLESL